MSRLNCTARIAIVVVTAFILAAPAPGLAARQPEGKIPRTGAWELVWSWLDAVVLPQHGAPRTARVRWENEGGGVDPNGTVTLTTAPPVLVPSQAKPGAGGR